MTGRYDDACRSYRKVLEINPKDTGIRKNLALAYLGSGKKDKAIKEFKKVLEINPKDEAVKKEIERLQK